MAANEPLMEPAGEDHAPPAPAAPEFVPTAFTNTAPAWQEPYPYLLPPSASGLEEMFPPPPKRQPFLRSVAWGGLYVFVAFWLCVAFLIATQVIPALIVVVALLVKDAVRGRFAPAHTDTEVLTREFLMPALAAAQVAGAVFSCLGLRLVAGRAWVRKVAFRRPGWFHLLLSVLLVPGLVIVSNGLYALAKRYLPPLPIPGIDMEKFVGELESWPLWLGVLIVGVGPGLSEELWCRAFLGRGLAGRNGVVARLLVSSFFFGLIHVDPRQGSMAAVMGLVLYFVYLTTRSLWMPMLIHFLNNSTSVVASHFENNPIDQAPEEIPLAIFATGAFLLVAILIALFQTRARLVREDGSASTWEPICVGIELPPPGSGVKVVQPLPWAGTVVLVATGVLAFAGTVLYYTIGQ
jgi:membrane protease YdiL (CAAX protease family)